MARGQCPLLAQSGHFATEFQSAFGVKQTLRGLTPMSAFDPKQTFRLSSCNFANKGDLMELLMPRNVTVQSNAAPIANLLAFALGAAAVGALAIGALAIGRVAIDGIAIKRTRFGKVEIDELTVRKLHVVENSG